MNKPQVCIGVKPALAAFFLPLLLLCSALFVCVQFMVPQYAWAAEQSSTASSNGVTFTVSWNDDVPAGQATKFHVSAEGASVNAKARMDVPTYWWPAYGFGNTSESVCDPSRAAWSNYASIGDEGCDFSFEFSASGTYGIYFYFMDSDNGIYYLRTLATLSVDDSVRPSVDQIVKTAVAKARSNTDGSEYQMALWLHDWLLDQLEYDNSLNWCSAESALTRGTGTCESYQRAYAKLLNAAGIANGRITGNGHTWNAVKIDGKWCQVDPTWDDNNDAWYGFNMRHYYFGLTDELMSAVHSDLSAQYQVENYEYRSTDLRNSYYVRNGEASKWAAAYKNRVQDQLDSGSTEFVISADGLNSESPYTEQIYNANVAYALAQMAWQASGKSVKLKAVSSETTLSFKAEYFDGSPVASPSPQASSAQASSYITLKKVKGIKLKAKKKAIKVSWKKASSGVTGYQIKYSKSKKMKSAKVVSVSKANANTKTLKKLKKKKRYYVQLRSYKKVGSKKYYSAWSSVKSVKAK